MLFSNSQNSQFFSLPTMSRCLNGNKYSDLFCFDQPPLPKPCWLISLTPPGARLVYIYLRKLAVKYRWFRGRIVACHAIDPRSIAIGDLLAPTLVCQQASF